jgi:hypothetical protein
LGFFIASAQRIDFASAHRVGLGLYQQHPWIYVYGVLSGRLFVWRPHACLSSLSNDSLCGLKSDLAHVRTGTSHSLPMRSDPAFHSHILEARWTTPKYPYPIDNRLKPCTTVLSTILNAPIDTFGVETATGATANQETRLWKQDFAGLDKNPSVEKPIRQI